MCTPTKVASKKEPPRSTGIQNKVAGNRRSEGFLSDNPPPWLACTVVWSAIYPNQGLIEPPKARGHATYTGGKMLSVTKYSFQCIYGTCTA